MAYCIAHINNALQGEVEGGRKGRLMGIITLSDVLRYVIGEIGLGDGLPVTEEDVDG